MKILLVSNFFPPTRSTGTENRALGYAATLQAMGNNVQVVCSGDWGEGLDYWHGFSDENYQQIPVRRVHTSWVWAPDPNRFLYDNPVIEENMEQWLDQWNPDIVHILSCLTLSASVIRAAKKRGLPVLLTLTDFWFICPRANLLRGDGSICNGITSSWDCINCLMWDVKAYRRLSAVIPERVVDVTLKWVSKHPKISGRRGFRGMAFDMDHRKAYLSELIESVDCLTAPSSHLADIFKACGVRNPIRVIHSGHDLSWLDSMPARTSSDRVRFGYIGQITPTKGVHILISAFLSSKLAGAARLIIAGDQFKDPEYTTYLKSLGDGKDGLIEYLGEIPHDHLGDVFAEIDVLVVPSQWHENNPRVIQEAFAGKTPVIASNVGGISEFVKHEVNGLLFDRDNVDDLSYQMKRVIVEPILIDKLREGIPPIKKMTDEVNELLSIYQSVRINTT